jgi:peptidyl-prolyl cis-trans isomerase C
MHRYLLPLMLILLVLSACSNKKAEKETPLAEVNGEVLSMEDFRSTFTDEQWNNLSGEQKKQEIQDWVNVTLLAQAADEEKLDEEKAVRQRIDYAAKKIKANALIAKKMANLDIGEEEMFNYYRMHQSDFQGKLQEYSVQRIKVKDAGTADILFKRLQEGYDFDAALREYDQESLRDNQGKMGFISATGADSLFWRAAHLLKQNEAGKADVSGGSYILRWTDKREGSQDANFGEYRSEIRTILLRDKQKQVYEDLLKELKMKAGEIVYY